MPGLLRQGRVGLDRSPAAAGDPGSGMESVATFSALAASGLADVPVWVADRAQPYWWHEKVEDLDVKEWLSARWVKYLRNAALDPFRTYSAGGDTVAILTARGWTPGLTGGSTLTDGVGGIRLTATGGSFDNANIFFDLPGITDGVDVACVYRANQIQGSNSANPRFAGRTIFGGNVDRLRTTWNDNNVQNQVRFFNAAGAAVGRGLRNVAAFDPVQIIYSGYGTGESRNIAPLAATPFVTPTAESFDSLGVADTTSPVQPFFGWANQNGTGDTSIIEFSATHGFVILDSPP